jgi:tRNA A-37 threonylcarbamoyl transferase component Bud32
MEVDDRRTPEGELGPQLAAGRDATIHDHGPGLVLRRTPTPRDHTLEALAMTHVRAAGYPVPEVHRVGPGELVLERIEGPTMLADLGAHPWRTRVHARTLAELHRRLHAIAAPEALLPHPVAGGSVLHLDLHPGNVICSPTGPVVIDWTNARRGAAEVDVALTWILMASSEVDETEPARSLPGRVRAGLERRAIPWIRRQLVSTFLASSGAHDAARGVLAEVAEIRLTDPNVRPEEARNIRSLVAESTDA